MSDVALGEHSVEPTRRRPMANEPPATGNGHEPRRRPSGGRVVDANAIERCDGRKEIRDTRLMDRADVALGCTVSAGLRALENARNVLVNRVRGDKPHLGREAALAREFCLLDRSRRSERRFDREGFPVLDVIEHEALALLRDRTTHVTRDRAIASEDLRATVVDVERVDAERRHGEVPRLAAARRAGYYYHAWARHRGSAGLQRRVRLREHVGRQSGRHEIAACVDDTEPLEAQALRDDPRGS